MYIHTYRSTQYWTRKQRGEYFPAYALDNHSLLAHMRSIKISPKYQAAPVKNVVLKTVLDLIRRQMQWFDGAILMMAILMAGVAIIVTRK